MWHLPASPGSGDDLSEDECRLGEGRGRGDITPRPQDEMRPGDHQAYEFRVDGTWSEHARNAFVHLWITNVPQQTVIDDIRNATQSWVDELVAAYGDGVGGVSIAVEAVTGHPGEVLCSAADGAELLVVGHRGRNATASRMIGSVGLHCVLHANCAVTVVRPDP